MQEIEQHIYPDIPGYEIHAELGRGGIATVYLAMQESLDRRVALKVMSPILAVEPDYAERFVREGRTIARLNHTNIITVYDIGIQKHKLYIAMEHIPAGNLRSQIEKHKGDADWALAVAGQMALALGYAHRHNVIHRDVKPENILFRENGVAVLTDFGIAKTISSDTNLTRAGAVVGTPRYMSPEQTDGLGNDPQTDIYSLGVVLFEMLTGRVPYDCENSMAVLYAHVHSPIPKLPHGLHDLQPLIDRMLAKKPEDRPADCDQLAEIIRLMRRERHNAIKKAGPGKVGESLKDALEIPVVDERQTGKTASPSDNPSSRIRKLTKMNSRSPWIYAAGAAVILLLAFRFWPAGDNNGENVIPPPPAVTESDGPVLPTVADGSRDNGREMGVKVVPPDAPDQPPSERERVILSEFLADDAIINPANSPATTRAKRLVHPRQAEIDELLDKARSSLEKGRLYSPNEDNAILWYQEALKIDPGNARALRGLKATADLLGEKARALNMQGDPDLALAYIDQGLQAAPEDKQLLALKEQINRSFNANESFSKAERLYHGYKGNRDLSRAAFYYRKAAEHGHREAMNALGVMYVDGKGLDRDEDEAMKWFSKAANDNDAEAMYNLALGYLFGEHRNPSRALPLATAAASLEYRPAYRLVGWMYTTGIGAPASNLQAFRWELKGMVNPVSEKLKAQYRNPVRWKNAFEDAYRQATDTGD